MVSMLYWLIVLYGQNNTFERFYIGRFLTLYTYIVLDTNIEETACNLNSCNILPRTYYGWDQRKTRKGRGHEARHYKEGCGKEVKVKDASYNVMGA